MKTPFEVDFEGPYRQSVSSIFWHSRQMIGKQDHFELITQMRLDSSEDWRTSW
jgi:hypothetical protein